MTQPHDPAHLTASSTGDLAVKHHGRVIVIYLIGMVVVVASAIALTLVLHTTGYLWPLTLLGAAVICTLLTAAALPSLRQD